MSTVALKSWMASYCLAISLTSVSRLATSRAGFFAAPAPLRVIARLRARQEDSPEVIRQSRRKAAGTRLNGIFFIVGGGQSGLSTRASIVLYWETRTRVCAVSENPPESGPVAQLGARFHGMEEVVSSNLTRSTKTSHNISKT